jgi:predicted membrane channel-forming protein YqfA (hemolysin III family)
MTHVTVRNGMTLAYMVALVNALLGCLVTFGVDLSDPQRASIITFVNVAVLLVARVLHLPEQTPTGTVRVTHVPALVTMTAATGTTPQQETTTLAAVQGETVAAPASSTTVAA